MQKQGRNDAALSLPYISSHSFLHHLPPFPPSLSPRPRSRRKSTVKGDREWNEGDEDSVGNFMCIFPFNAATREAASKAKVDTRGIIAQCRECLVKPASRPDALKRAFDPLVDDV